MAGTRPGVRVRGACKEGHVTETTADKGRVTWEGTCSHQGCDLPVKARRIPKDRVPPPPPADDPAAGTVRVVRIEDFDEPASHRTEQPGTGLAVADVPAAELDPAQRDESADIRGPADPLDEHGERSGPVTRWRERRRSARGRRARPYQHPLGI